MKAHGKVGRVCQSSVVSANQIDRAYVSNSKYQQHRINLIGSLQVALLVELGAEAPEHSVRRPRRVRGLHPVTPTQ